MSFGGTSGGSGSISASSDVALSSVVNNQVLTYNSGTQKWQNQTPAAAAVSTVAGRTGAIVLAESDITNLASDLSAKAPLASPTFTGTVTVPTPSNATDASTKGYVDTALSGVTVADASTSAKGKVQLAGDLAGTAGSPTVAKVNGIAISGTPSAGQALTASSSSAASWATPSLTAGTGTSAKVWITSTDPGSSAAEGDVWISA